MNRGSKGYMGQRSPIIVQGHQISPSAKSKKIAVSDTFLNLQNLKYVTLACNEGKSSNHIRF